MSLSSFLLGHGKKTATVDKELDALFKNAVESVPPTVSNPENLKRKHQDVASVPAEPASKKHKVKQPATSTSHQAKKQTDSPAKSLPKSKKVPKPVVKKKTTKDADVQSESDEDDENDSELENAYISRTLKSKGENKAPEPASEENDSEEGEDEEDAEDLSSDENNNSPLQHESLAMKQHPKKLPKSKTKYVPPDETPEEKNARTVFVGNLSVDVPQKKSFVKALQRHIVSLIPLPSESSNNIKPKIESTRFRSVPFAVPTSNLEHADADDNNKPSAKKGKIKANKTRQHDLDRSSTWKKTSGSGKKGEEEEGSKGGSEKQFLTPAQKKKIAFINQEIHASGSSVNAYIVFTHPAPPNTSDDAPTRKSNLPPLPEAMDPYEAARLAKEHCDGTDFMGRTLRVDVVGQNKEVAEQQGRVLRAGSDVDPKRCVFVGNLDFESREEDVRAFFEGVISAEKGPRVARDDGQDESVSDSDTDEEEEEGENERLPTKSKPKPKSTKGWITRVRIIRDKDTQLGKGFAYVQFAERDCVDEILAVALEPGKLKFAKRKLRVERCKTIPGASVKVNAKLHSSSTSSRLTPNGSSSSSYRPTPVPKGDPNLGAKLAHLSKEERKSAKAADPDRMVRRLAKKKARMALAVGKGGEAGSGAVKVQGKDRGRERKPRGGSLAGKKGKGHGVGSATKNKGKAISSRALEKRNAKK